MADQHPNPSTLWANRRRQAWLALAALLFMAGYALSTEAIPASNAELLGSIAYALASVVVIYHGGAAYSERR